MTDARRLLRWYDSNCRDLPWRENQDPYRILVSEFMLQQTRAEVVAQRFLRFVNRFPTLEALAAASEEEVMAEWSGLGYYRRARNLRASARAISKKTQWPESATELAELPGVGAYTSAAIASIAFGQRVAAMDGNVRRVTARLLAQPGITTNTQVATALEREARRLLDESRPGDSNQALMELGATVCKPQPRCELCPLAKRCLAHARGNEISYPHRPKAKPRSNRSWQVVVVEHQGKVWLQRRRRDARWLPGMFELPWVEGVEGPLSAEQAKKTERSIAVLIGHPVCLLEHAGVVSHAIGRRAIRAGVWLARPLAETNNMPTGERLGEGRWATRKQIRELPTTSLVGKALKKVEEDRN